MAETEAQRWEQALARGALLSAGLRWAEEQGLPSRSGRLAAWWHWLAAQQNETGQRVVHAPLAGQAIDEAERHAPE